MDQPGEWIDVAETHGSSRLEHADSGSLLITSDGEQIRAFNISDWSERYAIPGERYAVSSDSTGDFLAVQSADRIMIDHTHDGSPTKYSSSGWNFGDIIPGDHGQFVIAAGLELEIDPVAGGRRWILTELVGHCDSICLAPDGKNIILADGHLSTDLRFFPMDESPETVSLGGFTVPVTQVTVNKPTGLIAAGSLDHLVRVNVPVPDPNIVYDLQILTAHRSPVLCLAFSPDGQILVSGDEAGYINFWNVSAGHCPFMRTRSRSLQSPFHPTGVR